MNVDWHQLTRELSEHYPIGEAKALIRTIQEVRFNLTPVDIYLGKDKHFSTLEREELENILERLKKREPIQYILGTANFCEYTFKVNPSVLIPRPETEELVNWICTDALLQSPRILDIGTGSGCIAITLKKRIPGSQVTAFDISKEALKTARQNAENLQAEVTFCEADILKHLPERQIISSNKDYDKNTNPLFSEQWDIIVSNPPYICTKEAQEMDVQVLEHEPHTALFVPNTDPLLFYRAIGHYALTHLRPGGLLYFEINQAYGRETKELLEHLGLKQVEIRRDLYERERMIKCVR